MQLTEATLSTLSIAALATGGVIIRPWRLPEALWAVLGAAALIGLGLCPWQNALVAMAKGINVYLFLMGMMLAAELARAEGLFAWVAGHAAKAARGSATRLFALTYAVGTVVTILLSNDATAVVLTPAVYAAAQAARAEPLPYLLVCAFVANAASFVLPISNPANLVIFRGAMPPLGDWLERFLLPSALAIGATYVALYLTQRPTLRSQQLNRVAEVPALGSGGRIVAWGIAGMAVTLCAASVSGLELGWPTLVTGAAIFGAVSIKNRAAPWPTLGNISWSVLPLVAGLFVLVEAVEATGSVRALQQAVAGAAQSSPAMTAQLTGFGIAVASNLMNNLPAGLLASSVAGAAHAPPMVADAVLVGVDLGPNLSVTGSLATILWLTALRREGVDIGAWRFLKIGTVVMFPALVLSLAAVTFHG